MTMRKFSKHTPEQIVVKLEKAEALRGEGMSTAQACRVLGISEATLCRWRQRYGSMNRSEAKELRELREQNARLKQLLGKQSWKRQRCESWQRETSKPGAQARRCEPPCRPGVFSASCMPRCQAVAVSVLPDPRGGRSENAA